MFTLVKAERIESRRIPAQAGRRLLQYFQRHFGVPIHQFYHPEAVGHSTEEQPDKPSVN